LVAAAMMARIAAFKGGDSHFRMSEQVSVLTFCTFEVDCGWASWELGGVPRQLRIQYPGAIYHAINRGDRREDIFRDDHDRQCFLDTLAEACQKTRWQVHAWCLMRNHFHLVIETP
jgi:hypothetical protein